MTPIRRGLNKAIRTLLQLLASGGLTAAVYEVAASLDPNARFAVLTGFMLAVTFAQNTLETAGYIPVLLPSAPLRTDPPASTGPVVADTEGGQSTWGTTVAVSAVTAIVVVALLKVFGLI